MKREPVSISDLLSTTRSRCMRSLFALFFAAHQITRESESIELPSFQSVEDGEGEGGKAKQHLFSLQALSMKALIEQATSPPRTSRSALVSTLLCIPPCKTPPQKNREKEEIKKQSIYIRTLSL